MLSPYLTAGALIMALCIAFMTGYDYGCKSSEAKINAEYVDSLRSWQEKFRDAQNAAESAATKNANALIDIDNLHAANLALIERVRKQERAAAAKRTDNCAISTKAKAPGASISP